MDKYIKCPRCEINYILEKQKLCDVCKAELKLAPDKFSEDDEDMILCPVCKQNYIFPDEDMCSSCRENEGEAPVDKEVNIESDEEWRSYLDDEKETPVVEGEDDEISLSELQDEEADDDDEDDDIKKSDDDHDEYDDFGGKLDDYDDNFDDLDDDDDDDDEDESDDQEEEAPRTRKKK